MPTNPSPLGSIITTASLPIDLGDGMVLRRSSQADQDALVEFNSKIHGQPDKPDMGVAAWTADLLSGAHPTFGTDDFTIVEDTHSGRIVSACNLISQTWSYAGIPFGIGRPELVGTHPDYRNRGLVRRQFDVLHAWSKERGELVQAITGIPYFYRLYGYEMCVNLGSGRIIYGTQIKPLKGGEIEPYIIRPASEADIPELAACYARLEARGPLACLRDEAQWRYEISGKSALNVNRTELYIIADLQGRVVGALGVPINYWGESWDSIFYELKAGVSFLAVTPVVMRFLDALGKKRGTEAEPYRTTGFFLGEDHPSYISLEPQNSPPNRTYAWYMRVADLPAFLRHITPVLEKRLAASPCAGQTGDLRVTFFNSGLEIKFDNGRIAEIKTLAMLAWDEADARFPGSTFLNILFQHRSWDELRHIYAEVYANTKAAALLKSLFPRQTCEIWPIS